ncbi:MAG: hypothetical protein CM15mV142_330 [Caudoviricetes sp.]|nr:MAG: hypothetical protein CM15mV142_330 [Caudoviricetes sp.]
MLMFIISVTNESTVCSFDGGLLIGGNLIVKSPDEFKLLIHLLKGVFINYKGVMVKVTFILDTLVELPREKIEYSHGDYMRFLRK